jgi:hypothetical protein
MDPILPQPNSNNIERALDAIARAIRPASAVVQMKATNFTEVVTGTGLIPIDDTIPQITEGTEVMTQQFTPLSATNRLYIEVDMMMAITSNGQLAAALFMDAVANALATDRKYTNNFVSNPYKLTLRHDMVAGTTNMITFRVRGGMEIAGTLTLNGALSGRTFGATTKSSIRITEYTP